MPKLYDSNRLLHVKAISLSIVKWTFIVGGILLFIVLYITVFNSPILLDTLCEHGIEVNACEVCRPLSDLLPNYICPHNVQANSCNVCASLQHNLSTIAQCTHNWVPLNYDSNLVGSACDFGSSTQTHPLLDRVGDAVYYCTECHAVCCGDCYTG